MITTLLKARQGNLWTMKLAKQRNMSYRKGQPKATDDRCPLFGMQDSAGNILGGCMHEDMKALYIARHDRAMRQLLKQVLHGKHEAHYIIADVGTLDGLQQMGVHAKSIPAFVIPANSTLAPQQQGTVEDQARTHDRDEMRPDSIIVEILDGERATYVTKEPTQALTSHMQNGKPSKIWVVEGGYCTDTRSYRVSQYMTQTHAA